MKLNGDFIDRLKTQTRLLGGLTLTRVANYERMVREFGRSLASRTDWKACRIKEIEQSVFILFFLNWTSYKVVKFKTCSLGAHMNVLIFITRVRRIMSRCSKRRSFLP